MKKTLIKKLYFTFLLCSFISLNAGAADTTRVYLTKINRVYFNSYVSDFKHIVVSPFHWNKNKIITTSVFVATSAICYSQDKDIENFFQKNKTKTFDNISKHGLEPFGSGLYSLPIVGLFYVYGVAFKNDKSKETALLCSKALILTSLAGNAIKYSFHRHRPYEDSPPNSMLFDGPSFKRKNISFVSGHTLCITSIATIIASEYKHKKIIPILAYTIAGLSAISRVYDNKHWSSDVVVGAAVSFGISKLIFNFNKQLSSY